MALRVVAIAAVLAFATSAEARFGKSGSPSSSSSSSSSSASTSSGTRSTSSSSSSSSSSTYHDAAPVNSSSSASASSYRPSWGFGVARPWRYGYYSGAYVPRYGYGYGCYVPPVVYGAAVVEERTEVREPSTLRLDAGAEAMPFINGQVGMTFGAHILVEGDAWGFALTGQNILVRADDGSDTYDNIQQVGAHITYAFLSGKYGRLRVELGADTAFAPDVVMVGPTGGLSGSLWIGGPFALEGGVFVTPLPFKQLDYRAGLAFGLGAIGLRAGWRTQILDDNGVVDGVAHRDVFMGPYVGASVVF